MRRFISFRDFDWLLLGLVLLLSVISIFEIYSATLHTKFVGFETKQIFWLIGGLAAMFLFSLINYHRLLESVHWIYGFCLLSLVAVLAVGTKVMGGRRWIKLPGGIHFQNSLTFVVTFFFSSLIPDTLETRKGVKTKHRDSSQYDTHFTLKKATFMIVQTWRILV